MKMRTHFFKHVLIGLIVIAGFSAVVMLLWNIAVPSIFGLTAINFWQALVLLALVRILFGGLGGMRAMGGFGSHGGGFGKNPLCEKWLKMTPEERKEFVKNRHFDPRHCGHNFGEEFLNDESKKAEQRG
jgi:hypothetical protein